MQKERNKRVKKKILAVVGKTLFSSKVPHVHHLLLSLMFWVSDSYTIPKECAFGKPGHDCEVTQIWRHPLIYRIHSGIENSCSLIPLCQIRLNQSGHKTPPGFQRLSALLKLGMVRRKCSEQDLTLPIFGAALAADKCLKSILQSFFFSPFPNFITNDALYFVPLVL